MPRSDNRHRGYAFVTIACPLELYAKGVDIGTISAALSELDIKGRPHPFDQGGGGYNATGGRHRCMPTRHSDPFAWGPATPPSAAITAALLPATGADPFDQEGAGYNATGGPVPL